MVATGKQGFYRGVKRSLAAAVLILAWDVGLSGWFGASLIFCPIWFLVSLLKNTYQRPGWGLGLIRIAIPVVTLGIAWTNNSVQLRIANANAMQVVAACEEYHADHGKFPKSLNELVPQYMRSVPRAKYCVGPWCGFMYYFNQGNAMLVWYVVPPHYRRIYDFNTREWSTLD